jgi:hypothetical protein
MIASSSNGGTSWNTPVQVISGFEKPDNPIDRPWIAIDKSASIYSGRIYIVSKSVDDVTTLPHHVWMKYSANNGITWSTLTMLDDSTVNNLISNSMAVVTTGADGSIYAAYANWASVVSYPQFILKKSIDGGQTFSSSVIVTAVAGSGITDSLYQGSYSISANPTNYNNIVFISTDSRNGDPDILSVNSIDGGTTWTSNPIRLNDDSIGNGAGQEMCWGSFSVNGNYTCAWRDRRNSGSGSSAPFELFCSVSQDGGNTFSANAKLSTASSPVIPIVKGNDFLGVAIDSANVYSVWCDKRTGNTEIFFSKKAINTITTTTAIKNNFDFVKVTPNLSQGDFSIELNKNISSEISITSVDGRMIQQITLEANSIKTLSHIYIKNKGIYFLKVKAKSIEQIIKLVVT